MSFFLHFALLTCLTIVASVCWALYFHYSNHGHPYKAALADCGIILISAINVVSFTEDHRMLGASLIGTFVGTVWAIKRKANE
jgi:hypothetical protein